MKIELCPNIIKDPELLHTKRIVNSLNSYGCEIWFSEDAGFILDGVWITAFVMYRFGCRNYIALAIWSILMPTVIFCVFYYMLYVGLPLGVLAPILPKY